MIPLMCVPWPNASSLEKSPDSDSDALAIPAAGEGKISVDSSDYVIEGACYKAIRRDVRHAGMGGQTAQAATFDVDQLGVDQGQSLFEVAPSAVRSVASFLNWTITSMEASGVHSL